MKRKAWEQGVTWVPMHVLDYYSYSFDHARGLAGVRHRQIIIILLGSSLSMHALFYTYTTKTTFDGAFDEKV